MIKALKNSKKKLSDRTYEILEAEIISRALKPGTALKEEEIARQLNVSTIPVREAFNRLEQEGLVIRKPHCSAIVRPLKKHDVHELSEIREALECQAIRIAARKITKTQTGELEKIIKTSENHFNNGRIANYVKGNQEFHSRICQLAGNSRLEKIMGNINKQLTILMITTARKTTGPETGIIEHREIIKALSCKDEDLAEKLMRQHLIDTLQRLDDVLFDEDII